MSILGISGLKVFTGQRNCAPMVKRTLLGMLSATPLMLAILGSSSGSALAQAAPASAPGVETIVVTGSHIQRDGFEAPTPVTVTTIEQIQSVATNDAADYLNELPQFAGSTTPLSTAPGINNSQGSINGLSLRGLGAIRTLTLVNGQRVVGDISTGIVDVNQLPQQLIQRVDTVFGGASAVYGSDALTGVVNIILDNKYSGVKGEVSAGESNYGDDRTWKANLTAGTDFLGGRGHFEVSGEAAGDQGILGLPGVNHRSWDKQGYQMLTNPAYGTGPGQSTNVPLQIHESQTGMSNASVGGLITSGPLAGTIFGPGGSISKIAYGSLISAPFMQGGSWTATNQRDNGLGVALDPRTTNQNAYARVSYDIADDIEVYASAQWAHNHEESQSINDYELGNLTVTNQNPFIPAPILASMTANGITSFQMGTMLGDVPGTTPTYDRNVTRSLVGVDGDFNAFGTDWKWDVHGSYGYNRGYSEAKDTLESAQFAQAINVVRSPTGAIVCASTLVNPNDGCVPFNLFGTGVNSQSAINYVTSLPGQANNTNTFGGIDAGHFFHNHTVQVVEGFNVSGSPFSDWAGPISIATGFEHRKESLGASADPGEAAQAWFITSGTPYSGSFGISEGYLETDIPLADNYAWAKSLDFDAAARITSYSTFGVVETWKLGLNYTPPSLDGALDGFRFRANFSHDLREPTLVDYYSAPVSSNLTIADPFVGNKTVPYFGYSEGNPNLKPESAISLGLGLVYQPTWLEGFSASFDYYNITIEKAIISLSAAQILNECYQGQAVACAGLQTVGTQNGLPILQITTAPLNFQSEKATGFDFDASYNLAMEDVDKSLKGDLNLQMHVTHAMSDVQTSDVAGVAPIDIAGENATAGPPHWKYQITANYVLDPVVLGLTLRGVSAGKYNTNWITCTTACPVSTSNNVTTDYNRIASAWYIDLNTSYNVSTDVRMYFNVRNLFNLNPPAYYPGPSGNAWQTIPAPLYNYDILGRIYRLGIRFDM
jgi:outer membrane receptor protein involved in Fe transport